MKVNFLFETGATISYGVRTSDTVKNVLRAISCGRQLLVYDGQTLHMAKKLSDYDIQQQSTIEVTNQSPSTPRAWLGEGFPPEPKRWERYSGPRESRD